MVEKSFNPAHQIGFNKGLTSEIRTRMTAAKEGLGLTWRQVGQRMPGQFSGTFTGNLARNGDNVSTKWVAGIVATVEAMEAELARRGGREPVGPGATAVNEAAQAEHEPGWRTEPHATAAREASGSRLTIAEAKRLLAEANGVPISAVRITIDG